jgi:hypothetical protein
MPDVRIERIANGYEVCLTDPEIVKANRKPNSKYQNADREYAFKTVAEVMKFLESHLDAALPADDYESSFDAAVADATEEDD